MAQLLALVLLASLLRLPTLGDRSLWLDEINVAAPALSGIWPAIETARIHVDAAPLDYVLVAASQALFGRGEIPARLPAAIFGIGSVVAIYFLGRALANHWVGLLAGLLLATSPGHVWYSQEARFYSMLAFLSIVTTLAFLAAVKHGRWWLWVVYASTIAVGLYAGYQMAFIVAIHIGALAVGAIFRWWRAPPRAWAAMALAVATAALLFLPWYLWDERDPVHTYRSPPLDAEPIVDNLAWLLSYNSPVVFSHSPVDAAWGIVALVIAAAAAAVLGAWKSRQPFVPVAAGAAVVLPVALLVILRHQQYFFAPRHLMFLLPIIYLLIAYGSHQAIRTRLLAPFAVGALAGLLVVAAFGLDYEAGVPKQEFRQAADYLQSHMSEDDRLVAFGYRTIWYYHDFGEVSKASTREDIARFVEETPGEAWIYMTYIEVRRPIWQKLGPVLMSDQFERIDFRGVRIFRARGGSQIELP